ncbi:uncharacterized protein LOC126852912, partial [Cataglyphis hispanica]|uniref:uncharacterized protein LOC126852912 n=1 Tax=Cataglyphis hispanica TaxID=1086592 RepID=UPI00217F7C6C
YLRMDIPFNESINLVKLKIEKQHVRTSIPASTRLQICLRYLVSGDTMCSISFAFRVGLNTVSKIVSELCYLGYFKLFLIVALFLALHNYKSTHSIVLLTVADANCCFTIVDIGKVFNYMLSRTRRIIECSFGILSARWRIFRKPFSITIENAISVI